ncbi:zf-CCHC domain-containing protein/RVP_2 domain-containing protein [Cephalotus follicularis]|uniref:Zf-CCHC domain-containing protein/RVP_2 domain-containing protein n=1 Tax=Cephalotus follicularis TaxID=3775 RepID=A0A1Q3ARR3_CEPFO|nr:zf-CCHC domain-containing protein/RVP_2 domain-containing protein [Cephalotus follicularis]
MILEADADERRAERSRVITSKAIQSRGQGSNNPSKLTRFDNKGQGSSQRTRSRTPNHNRQQNASGCTFCGRPNHDESECWKKMGKCLKCGSQGHILKDCPMIREQVRGQQGNAGASGSIAAAQPRRDTGKGIMKGRVYTLSKDDVPESTTVVGGTIHISGILAHVLIDPGATHSFISSEFARNLHVIPRSFTCIISDFYLI